MLWSEVTGPSCRAHRALGFPIGLIGGLTLPCPDLVHVNVCAGQPQSDDRHVWLILWVHPWPLGFHAVSSIVDL